MIKIEIKDVQLVPVEQIKRNPKNRNKHPKEQIDELARHYQVHGMRTPIIVSNQSGFISAGDGRFQAALAAKMTHVPVSFQDFETPEKEFAFGVADNGLSLWSELDLIGINDDIKDLPKDFNLNDLGIKDFKLVDAEVLEPGCDEDAVPEHVEPKTKLGDLYKLGNHRLLCGDSTNIQHFETLMANEKANLILALTDPPYGVSVVKSGKVGADFGVAKKGNYKEIAGDDTTDVAKEFYQTAMAFGIKSFILWGGNYFSDFLAPSGAWIIWNKRGDTSIQNTFADAELAWSNLGFPARIHSQLWNGMIRAGEKDKRVHPTQKPIDLLKFCIELKNEYEMVFDAFGGSGSTLIACEKTKRKCFMMELDPHYCDVIVARWEKYTGQTAELISG